MSAPGAAAAALDLTTHWAGFAALAVFALAYLAVMGEERLGIRKSQPVILGAGVIWAFIGIAYVRAGDDSTAAAALRHAIGEYGELFLFILVAMTFVNTMEERQVFDALRAALVRRRLSLRAVFWITGGLAFLLSSSLDNLTTALVMGTVAVTVGRGNPGFIGVACINVVVAANAGGAFSPFGDITTLMVWQAGRAEFWDFFRLFVPSLVNWLVPAFLMSLAVPRADPEFQDEDVRPRRGAAGVIALFGLTIAMAVSAYNLLRLPPVLGMMTGLGLLKLYGLYLQRTPRPVPAPAPALAAAPTPAGLREPALVGGGDDRVWLDTPEFLSDAPEFGTDVPDLLAASPEFLEVREDPLHAFAEPMADPLAAWPAERARAAEPDGFDIFDILRRAEWDTLMFFYGIIVCVGGLAQIGYLAGLSERLYGGVGATWANVGVGVLSSVVDNIPVMYAVLNMNPAMDLSQWLLVTLTAGVGGSMLAIGSAAGVALMGQSRGYYTFGVHLRWTWAIALGYAASIAVHLLMWG